MPRPSAYERASLYVSRMPAAIAKQGGHNATFAVAMVLLQGFDLSRAEARNVLDEFNTRCDLPWNDRELDHKLNQADKQSGFSAGGEVRPRGCLRDDGGDDSREETQGLPARPAAPAPVKPEFDLEALKRAAGRYANEIDLVWLANRSALDPAFVTPAKYLSAIYKPGENVVVFTNEMTQGEAVWPADKLPETGARGVWYLCQPSDAQYHPNPRSLDKKTGKPVMSRRSEESVTAWRYMVIESDEAPLRLWLAALVQLPLRIVAIYTSGGRSIHALVKVDAVTKAVWDSYKFAMKAGLVILGADPGALSAVRLTRLPGCYREGKDVEMVNAAGKKVRLYERFPRPVLQKLLYLNPAAPLRPLCDMLATRDVENDWLKLAAAGVADTDDTGAKWIRAGLEYYAKVSPRLKSALATFGGAGE